MNRAAAVLLLSALAATPARAEYGGSLLFTEGEMAAIAAALAAAEGGSAVEDEPPRALPVPSVLYLAAVMGSDISGWRARLNDRWLGVGETVESLRVAEITADGVTLVAADAAPAPSAAAIVLRPNQSAILPSGTIVEGRPAAVDPPIPEAAAPDRPGPNHTNGR